jgi:hypothetical protein
MCLRRGCIGLGADDPDAAAVGVNLDGDGIEPRRAGRFDHTLDVPILELMNHVRHGCTPGTILAALLVNFSCHYKQKQGEFSTLSARLHSKDELDN